MKHASRSVYAVFVLMLLSLLLLILAPAWWEVWRLGQIPLPLPMLLLAGMGFTASCAAIVGRTMPGWWRYWWWGWPGSWLLVPLLMVSLDMRPAVIVSLLSLGMLALALYSAGWSEGGWNETGSRLLIVCAFAFVILIGVSLLRQHAWTGPCHMFSSLRRAGCQYSLPLRREEDALPVLVGGDTGSGQLAVPYGSVLWLEPVNRWQRLLQSRRIILDHGISGVSIEDEGTRVRAFHMYWEFDVSESGMQSLIQDSSAPKWRVDVQTLIDPVQGEKLFQIEADLTTEMLEAYREVRDGQDATADGRLAASVTTGKRGVVSLTEDETGRTTIVLSLPTHGRVEGLLFSPDGDHLLVSLPDENVALIIDVETMIDSRRQ